MTKSFMRRGKFCLGTMRTLIATIRRQNKKLSACKDLVKSVPLHSTADMRGPKKSKKDSVISMKVRKFYTPYS
jgi:hypothetical protein